MGYDSIDGDDSNGDLVASADDGVDENETGRIEALSDGVFAIAITLLVIDLKSPQVEGSGNLLRAVAQQWPAYLAYATSFWSIGLAWMIHHYIFRAVRHLDHLLLLINALLLLVVAFVPHPTAVVGDYLRDPQQQGYALMLFSGTWLLLSVCLNLLWWHARHAHLLARNVDHRLAERMARRLLYGPPLYLFALILSYVSFVAALGVYAFIGVLYTLPGPESRALRQRRRTRTRPVSGASGS